MTTKHVLIREAGMVTPVGFGLEPSFAAIRAAIDGFREVHLISSAGEPVIGADVPLARPVRGIARQALLLAAVLREVAEHLGDTDLTAVPVLVCVAERDRPGRLDGLGESLFSQCCDSLELRFHPKSRVLADGRVAGATALYHARRLIHEDGFAMVIIAAVDSYLVAETLHALERDGRLLSANGRDGLIPGEAAAALVVARDDGAEGLLCKGLGFATDPSGSDAEEPKRADGLTAALRAAFVEAELAYTDIDYRISDLSGEQRRFRESALALARTMREYKEELDLWHPADCIGEVGAAALPVMLSVALAAARKGCAPGPGILAELGNDDGRRAAVLLTFQRGSSR